MGKVRLLLALSVVMYHCGSIFGITLIGGTLAVQSFFIISGFYMSVVLNEKYIGANNSYKLFLSNRLLRLYPLYWTIFILTLIEGLALAMKAHTMHIEKFDGYFALKGNIPSFILIGLTQIIVFGQDLAYSFAVDPVNGHLFFSTLAQNSHPLLINLLMVPQAWSIGSEITFYLIAPFILRKKPWVVLGFIALSFLFRLYIYTCYPPIIDNWQYKFFPSCLMFFLLGYVSYRIYLKIKNTQLNNKLGYLILTSFVAETFLYPYIPNLSSNYFPFNFSDSLYYVSTIVAVPFLFMYFKSDKLDNKIGELSYPIYLP